MAMKALSGILVTRGHSEGNVTIHFTDRDEHTVTGTLDRAFHTKTNGGRGRFTDNPCKMVALREISFRESGDGRTGFPRGYKFEINDTRITRDLIEIKWEAHNCLIEEISYMIIGDTPD
ncbi:MAG: hypothetical protein ABFR97_11850 [Thermodesulfobacteriota bacterium]